MVVTAIDQMVTTAPPVETALSLDPTHYGGSAQGPHQFDGPIWVFDKHDDAIRRPRP